MHSLSVTPWVDHSELLSVFNAIYHSEEDKSLKQWARNKLTNWMSRSSANHSGYQYLQATQQLLTAFVEDIELVDPHVIYNLFSIGIIAFSSIFTPHGKVEDKAEKSIKKLAESANCPSWIIECRHSLCHSGGKPSFQLLKSAASLAIVWLKEHFWDVLLFRLEKANKIPNLVIKFLSNKAKVRNTKRKELIPLIRLNKSKFCEMAIELLLTEAEVRNNHKLKLCKKTLRKFAPLFTLIVQTNCVNLILHSLVNDFDNESQTVQTLARGWILAIVSAIGTEEKQSRFSRTFAKSTEMSRAKWLQLLYHILRCPDENTASLLEALIPLVGNLIKKKQIVLITKLIENYVSLNEEDDDDNIEDAEVHELNMIAPELHQEEGVKTMPVKLIRDIDWWKHNLGSSIETSMQREDGNNIMITSLA